MDHKAAWEYAAGAPIVEANRGTVSSVVNLQLCYLDLERQLETERKAREEAERRAETENQARFIREGERDFFKGRAEAAVRELHDTIATITAELAAAKAALTVSGDANLALHQELRRVRDDNDTLRRLAKAVVVAVDKDSWCQECGLEHTAPACKSLEVHLEKP